MKKKIKQSRGSILALEQSFRNMYINKYYNLYMRSMKWEGLKPEQTDYIMRRFWGDGTVACFPIRHTNELGFAPYAAQAYNMYDLPSEVRLINKWNTPFIPESPQIVKKDVVIGWAQANHKPIRMIVEFYVDRIVEVELVLNTQLQTSKLPFMVGVSPADVDKAKDIVDRILNNEIAVFADLEDLAMVKSFTFGNNYIIDKLYSYKTSLENELLTYLGLDNAESDDTKDRLIVDQVNANNNLINANLQGMLENLKDFIREINETFDKNISIKPLIEPAESVHDVKKTGGEDNENNN